MVSTPKPPDPYKVASAQGQANTEAAIAAGILNNMNEVSPYGNVVYTQTGSQQVGKNTVPQYTRTVTLTPAQQQMLDQQNQLGINLNDLAIGQVDRLGGVLDQPVDLGTTEQSRIDAQNALLSRLEPQFQRDRSNLDAQLIARGLTPGSEAYNEGMDQHNRMLTDARMQAVLAGGQEQAHQAQLRLAERNQPINEISALMSGGQVTVPQFSAPYQQGIQPAPVADSIWNSYNAQANQAAAANSGLFGLGSSALGGLFMLSDVRAKEDIRRVGQTDGGLPVYTFRYKGDTVTHMGVMAQDVEMVAPEAVAEGHDGLKRVDYARVR